MSTRIAGVNPSVLIIGSDVQTCALLRVALESTGHSIHEARTGEQGLKEMVLVRPDLVVLDLRLRGEEGLEVLRCLRERSLVPVVVLTDHGDEAEKVTALDAGADDYVTRPVGTGELLARLRAAQRRARPVEGGAIFTRGELFVDLVTRRVTHAGAELKLTATEYALLRVFVCHAGRVLTHRHLLREVWGPNSAGHRQYLGVYITHLRQKIERDPKNPELIQTEAGIGYRFSAAD